MLGKFLDRFCQLLDLLMAVALAIMVVLVYGNVVLRYAMNSGITLSEELSRWLFVWLTFMGAISALRQGTHLGSDTVVSRLPLAGKKFCFVVGHLLMLFVCYLLTVGSWAQVVINWDTTSAVMEVSMAYFYFCGVVLGVMGGLVLLESLWRFVTGRLPESELIGIRESEEEPVDVPAPVK